jgi:hypothetical protein
MTTSPLRSGLPPTSAARSASAVCCGKSMSTVSVTDRGAQLTLHSCTSCGRHVWERDGRAVDRAGMLEGMQAFLAEPRPPVRRRRRTRADG